MSEPNDRPDPKNPIDPAVAEIIRRKAACLVRRAGFATQDRDDLEQELKLCVLEALRKFDPEKGRWPAFVQRVIDRYGGNLARSARRAARRSGPTAPLPGDLPAPAGADPALAADVAEILTRLPGELRTLAERLLTESIAGAARELRVARSTAYARLVELGTRPDLRELAENP